MIEKLKKTYKLLIKIVELKNVQYSRVINDTNDMYAYTNEELKYTYNYYETSINETIEIINQTLEAIKLIDINFQETEINYDTDDFHELSDDEIETKLIKCYIELSGKTNQGASYEC
jgi:hypothetical protein